MTMKPTECQAGDAAGQRAPRADEWLREAKQAEKADLCGMYLFHNGVVRRTAKAAVRQNATVGPVRQMRFSFDGEKVAAATDAARAMAGIYYVRVWLNQGVLSVGDDLMLVLIGGDIRPRVIAALESLVGELKTSCVTEEEVS